VVNPATKSRAAHKAPAHRPIIPPRDFLERRPGQGREMSPPRAAAGFPGEVDPARRQIEFVGALVIVNAITRREPRNTAARPVACHCRRSSFAALRHGRPHRSDGVRPLQAVTPGPMTGVSRSTTGDATPSNRAPRESRGSDVFNIFCGHAPSPRDRPLTAGIKCAPSHSTRAWKPGRADPGKDSFAGERGRRSFLLNTLCPLQSGGDSVVLARELAAVLATRGVLAVASVTVDSLFPLASKHAAVDPPDHQ
jgi:hypothetical protein